MAILPAPARPRAELESEPAPCAARSEVWQGSRGEKLEVWIPPALLLVAWSVGWIAEQTWMPGDTVLWALVPTGVILLVRVLLEKLLRRSRPGARPLVMLYVLHLVLVAIGTLLNPMTCIYTFVGYIDSQRFLTGGTAQAVVVVTALLCAVGQLGGVQVVLTEVWFFIGLAVVNMLIAVCMMFLAGERERILDQREQALTEIDRVNRENAQLHEQLMAGARRAGADEERDRLSREIHDTVAQGLIGVIRQLEMVGSDVDPASRQHLAIAEEAARDCLLEARRAVEALGPHQLHDTGLVEALSALVARWARTHRVVATFDADEAPWESRHGHVLVRVAQESLANIARHAGAGTVTATLLGDEKTTILRIVDDGRGFEPGAVERGHGLSNMVERARRVDGRLEISSAPGQGTTVTATVPR
ncbi:hypothetical protein BH708_02240 [Brachybacterium sp. P6-10-X1]|uniref:sensor histidine kinase n=1 Tax=Brachybacterium sp. P6-10-X1 TaxID=1903186 RepID=UPI0009718F28|nr:sensor histidine kinase [Brachybacterium sp. P6-10-X1]APX31731.1 hypothetical protein BH708_02240 [Brachybacterium sp. P6-10-X1]